MNRNIADPRMRDLWESIDAAASRAKELPVSKTCKTPTRLSEQWRKEAKGLNGNSVDISRAITLAKNADSLDARKAELVKAIMSLPTHSNIGFDMQRRAAKIVEEGL